MDAGPQGRQVVARVIPAIPQSTVSITKHFESCVLKAYRDSRGYWTQGWGRLLTTDKAHPGGFPDIDQATADEWLVQDLRRSAVGTWAYLDVMPTSNLWAALVDFVFNLGATRFRASTLRREVNAGASVEEIAFQISRWTAGNPADRKGLTRRRAGEIMILKTGGFDPSRVDDYAREIAPELFQRR